MAIGILWAIRHTHFFLSGQSARGFFPAAASAFVAYVLSRLGMLPAAADWSVARPCDLSSTTTAAPWSAIDAAYAPDRLVSSL